MISNLPCLAAIPSPGKGFRSQPRVQIRSRNPERQPAAVYSHVQATSYDGAGSNRIDYCFFIGSFQRRRGGICGMCNSLSSISTLPRLRALERTLQIRNAASAQHGKQESTGFKSPLRLVQSVTPGVASDGGRGHRIPLGSYRLP